MEWYSDWQCQERRSDSNKNVKSKQAIGLIIICAKQDSTRLNKRRRFHLSFSKLRCCSHEYKSRKIHRHLVKRDRIIAMKIGKTPIFFLKKFHLLTGRSQRTSRCSRRLQLNMTAISGWQFSGKLLKTLPKRLYIYIYIGCTSANHTFLNTSFHYQFKGPRVLKQHRQRLVTQKVKSRYFKLYSDNSISFNSSNVGNIFWN